MSVLTDPSTYPISAAAARQLDRPLFGHVVDGEVVPSLDGGTMPVIDPATGEQVATAAAGSAADVQRAVRSARAAFDDGRWRYLAPLEQERRLRRLSALIAEHGDELAELDVIDSGLLRMYAGFIVQFAVDGLDYYSGWPSKLHGSIPAVPHEFAVYQVREPIGVVGTISPWNGPTAAAAMATFALCAGNSVVLKPAEQTPMTAVVVAELALEAGIPPGVFNVVQGVGETVGAALVAHPDVDAITFTGSNRDRARHPGLRRRTREAREPRARRQEPVDHLPGRRSGGRLSRRDDGRVGRVGPGLHVRHPRDGPRERPRRGRRQDRRGVARDPHRRRLRSGHRHGPGRVGRAARAHPALRAHRPGRGRRAGARRIAPRRPRLLPRADRLHRRPQRDDDRAGGDLRARDGRAEVLHRGGGVRHRQRRRVRARRRRLDERHLARPPRDPRAARRHRVGQHVPDGLPVRALRRRQAVRPRPQPRRGLARRATRRSRASG